MIVIMVKSKYYVTPECLCVSHFSLTKNISHFLYKLLVRSTFDGLGITSSQRPSSISYDRVSRHGSD